RDLARQRIVGTLVQLADPVTVEALFLDLEVGPEQGFRGQFFDREADRFGGRIETLVPNRAPSLAAAAGKQFRRRPEVNYSHNQLLLAPNMEPEEPEIQSYQSRCRTTVNRPGARRTGPICYSAIS